jgi:dynein heavy chain
MRPTDDPVKMMELCCHMFGFKVTKANIGKVQNDPKGYFDLAKRSFLNNPNKFLEMMTDFDKEHQSEGAVKKVNAILNTPGFTAEKVKGSSSALSGVYRWAGVMVKYHELLKIVNPRRAKVKEMQAELAIVREKLAKKIAQLKEVEEVLATLQAELDRNEEEGRRLENKINDCNLKLVRAGKIITGLAGEKERWTVTVAELGREYELLVGNSLVAAGMVAYGGAFTSRFRSAMEEEWVENITKLGIKVQPGCTMQSFLEDPVMTKCWVTNGLPSDTLSVENALIMFKSRRWSLMIDPQNQASKFLKLLAREKELCPDGLDAFKAKRPTLLRDLEISIQFGRWVLIENVGEELDPALDPILLKLVSKQGNLRLGDKEIPWNENFKFFLTTTLPNPKYSPETQVKVTILNFAITPAGLEDQMLNQFVMQEMPDLQKKKDGIVAQNAQAAKTLRDIEEKILYNLTKNSEIKAILEEDTLINVLDESGVVSADIKVRMAEAAITEKDIDATRETFRPVAFRAQILFFTIVELAVIDPMY